MDAEAATPQAAIPVARASLLYRELVQIDGSPHAWLEARGPRCTLIAFIDDATSRLQYARFESAETTRAYLSGLRAYLTRFGRPVTLYSDRRKRLDQTRFRTRHRRNSSVRDGP